MSDPSCRGIRESLGVYVVGAIDPAERGVVDGHLSQCHDCREELAGLAGLPALLRRVPLAEAERLASPDALVVVDDPRPELLSSVLHRVADRRRTRRLRAIFSTAAALLIAAGGGAAVTHSLAPQQVTGPTSATEAAHATGHGVVATVRYGKSNWGIEMWVQATGIQPGTTCKFWVLTKGGQRQIAGGWTVGTVADPLWYPAEASIGEDSLSGFEITSGNSILLRIPAAT